MKALMLVGILLVVLGVVSFFVPFPRAEHHGFHFRYHILGIKKNIR